MRPLVLLFSFALCLSCQSAKKVASVLPEGPEAKALRLFDEAKKLHDAGDYPAAREKLTDALELNPKLWEARTLLGREALAEGNVEEAKGHFSVAAENNKTDAEAALGLGNVYTQTEQLNEAEVWLRKAKELAPESPRVYYFFGELYAKGGRLDVAKDSYREAIRLDPGYAWPRIGLARLLRQEDLQKNSREHHEEALRLTEEAAQVDDDLDEPQHLLGLLHSDVKDYPAAEKAFREAARLNEKSARNHMNLGTILAWQGSFPEAITSFQKAIELEPEYPLAHNNLGHVLKESKRLDDAIVALGKAATLAPETPLYRINLGDALISAGRYPDAAAAYQAAYEKLPGQAALVRKLSQALSRSGDLAGAYKTLDTFCRAYPSDKGIPALQEEMRGLAREELKSQLR